jgi:hypothetical protein
MTGNFQRQTVLQPTLQHRLLSAMHSAAESNYCWIISYFVIFECQIVNCLCKCTGCQVCWRCCTRTGASCCDGSAEVELCYILIQFYVRIIQRWFVVNLAAMLRAFSVVQLMNVYIKIRKGVGMMKQIWNTLFAVTWTVTFDKTALFA